MSSAQIIMCGSTEEEVSELYRRLEIVRMQLESDAEVGKVCDSTYGSTFLALFSLYQSLGNALERVKVFELDQDLSKLPEEERIAKLHELQRHPEYEYEQTTTPRKSYISLMPEGEGWEPNYHVIGNGRNWERFDYTEVEYWMRKKVR